MDTHAGTRRKLPFFRYTVPPVNNLQPTVTIKNGEPVTNSRDVAELFGKRHDSVLEAVRTLKDQLQKNQEMFRDTLVETQVGNGAARTFPAYDMNRDGFTLLVMGFTGKKALKGPSSNYCSICDAFGAIV